MRVVLDTNCLLQILGAHSQYNFLLDKFLDEKFTLCISTDILLEYEEILKEKASPVAADMFLKMISRSRNVVHKDPFYRLGLIEQDPDDNKFVDCAFKAGARYIVTQDHHYDILRHIDFPAIDVISIDDFLQMLA